MIIGIAGLGLIGGSIAKATKAYTAHTVLGYDISAPTLDKAIADGSVDGVLDNDSAAQCDIIIVALYPEATLNYIKEIAHHAKKGTILTDVCGIKRSICKLAELYAASNGLTFIGGHPMAGTERSGYDASVATLFAKASMLLAPSENVANEKVQVLKSFYTELCFARIVITTPEEHDAMIAYTSQLAHVSSCAYINSPKSAKHVGFSAGSYQDMTRVARINSDMWTELFLDNRDNLIKDIDRLIYNLTQFRNALDYEDDAKLKQLLNRSNDIKVRTEGGSHSEKING